MNDNIKQEIEFIEILNLIIDYGNKLEQAGYYSPDSQAQIKAYKDAGKIYEQIRQRLKSKFTS